MTARIILTLTIVVTIFSACSNNRSATQAEREKVQQYNDSGTILRNNANYEDAIKMHRKALRMAMEYNDTIGTVKAYNNIGTDMRRLGALENALEYHAEALKVAEMLKNDTSFDARKNFVKALNGLGNIQLTIGDNEEAAKIFRRALEGERELKSDVGMAINYANLGSILEKEGKLDSALIYYNEAMEHNVKGKSDLGIGLCHEHLGEIAEKRGYKQDAVHHYTQSYETLSKLSDTWHWLEPLLALAKISSNPDEAEAYLKTALDSARSINSLEHMARALELLSQVEEKRGDKNMALKYLKQHEEVNDSIIDAKKLQRMQTIRVNYERDKSREDFEKMKQLRHDDNVRNSIIVVSLAIFLLLCGIIIFYMWRLRHLQDRQYALLRGRFEQLLKMKEEAERKKEENIQDSNEQGKNEKSSIAIPSIEDTYTKEELDFLDGFQNCLNLCLKNHDISIDAISREMCMSYSNLNRKVKEITGYTVNAYMVKLRLTKAKRLLDHQQSTIGEVATACGFNDNSYFTRAFKQAYGITPTQYRNEQ